MKIVTAHQGILRTVRVDGLRGRSAEPADLTLAEPDWADGVAASPARPGTFQTGLALLDAAAPGGAFELGVVHELLYPPRGSPPRTFALLLAIAAARARAGPVIWSDPQATLYPPAIARAGLPLDRLLILRPRSPADELWAATQCMRCQGVAVTIVEPGRLNRVQARRLQLAVEKGGGTGLLLRSDHNAADYAAATRWLVRPEPSVGTHGRVPDSPVIRHGHTVVCPYAASQRWRVELVHGHGGRLRQAIILEVSREVVRTTEPDGSPSPFPAPHPVRAIDPMADRPAAQGAAARTA
ncbi:ImuA family protein [Humisphaera borealis]|uniref:Recombinase A n=1 Tax=Humisphaera borealis TaxID=2807512 RepID=A0A7M2X261_9BACT|nr:hypothetical protein [Humisphaera borealis]QOV90840.1 hypothetical protein IPV69_05635 [Humisphaera borealis]